jgi:hypothetical protein
MPADYPKAIKSFYTYQDQPWKGALLPDGSDPSIDYAYITNEINDEVAAFEKAIGPRPFMVPGTTTLSGSITWLYAFKADVDHNHYHWQTVYHSLITPPEHFDDHTNYVRTDGSRGFSAPEVSPPGLVDSQLVNLSQVKAGNWITLEEFEFILALALAQNHVTGCGGQPWLWGPPPVNTAWKLTGGWSYGYTDYNGNIYVPFGSAFQSMVLTFVFMKMPIPGRSHYGYTYNYQEDQLLLQGIDTRGAIVRFSEDNAIDRQAWVTMSWIACGY